MPRTDYHTHTPLCMHAVGEPEVFVKRALALGMSAYGISDHAPLPPGREHIDALQMSYRQLQDYFRWIERARDAARGTGLSILAGLECDWLPGVEPWVEKLRGEYDWDYFIGSVHFIGSCNSIADNIFEYSRITGSVEGDWRAYWSAVCAMVQSGLFDIVGHMDVIKCRNVFPDCRLMPLCEPALNALEGSGMVVELNAAGWHRPCERQYPSDALLRELLRRRIPIAIDSDAHSPEQLSRDWERAHQLLASLCTSPLRAFTVPARHSRTPLNVYGPL